MRLRHALLGLGFAIAPLQALADDIIRTSPQIELRAGYKGYPEFEECAWMTEYPAHLVEYAKGQVELTDASLDTVPGRTLRVRIMHMRTADGGGFSGPKWAMIRAELYDDGKLIGQYQPYRRTMTMFRDGCSSLSKISDALAEDTAAWLRRGNFKIEYPDDQATIEIGPEEDVPPIQ